jgi:hypothetical protein
MQHFAYPNIMRALFLIKLSILGLLDQLCLLTLGPSNNMYEHFKLKSIPFRQNLNCQQFL